MMGIKEFEQKLKSYDMKDIFDLVIPIPSCNLDIEPDQVMLTEVYHGKDENEGNNSGNLRVSFSSASRWAGLSPLLLFTRKSDFYGDAWLGGALSPIAGIN